MYRNDSRSRSRIGILVSGAWALAICGVAGGADDPGRIDPADEHPHHAEGRRSPGAATGATLPAEPLDAVTSGLRRAETWLVAWYRRTPPAERVTWGGMTACAGLGVLVLLDRLAGLRRRRIIPADFTARFLDRLHEGRLDCGQALDHCELNPSPAARVALAAVRRWGRSPGDLERAVALAHRVESDRLRRNVGTLRRIAALAPLLGLLGTLFALGRALEAMPSEPLVMAVRDTTGPTHGAPMEPVAAWAPPVASALAPLCFGVAIATLALVAYDGLLIRIEKLAGELDRLGAETIDAIAMAAPISPPVRLAAPDQPRAPSMRADQAAENPHGHTQRRHEGYSRVEDRRERKSRASHQDYSGF
jgi:biopolymer transport protein ExbB